MSGINDPICNLCQKPKSEHKTIIDRDDNETWLVCGEFEAEIVVPEGCVCHNWSGSPTEICGLYSSPYPKEWQSACSCGHDKACHKGKPKPTLAEEGKEK